MRKEWSCKYAFSEFSLPLPVDKSAAIYEYSCTQHLPCLMIFLHSNVFNPQSQMYSSVVIRPFQHTHTHSDFTIKLGGKNIPTIWSYLHIHANRNCFSSRFIRHLLTLFIFFLLGANESHPQALWRLKEPLQWAAGRLHREPGHVRQKTKERWMWYKHKTTHARILVNMSPTESMQMHAAHTKTFEREKNSIFRGCENCALGSCTLICSAIDICHVAFMNRWCLTDYAISIYYGGLGSRGNAIKD